MKGNSNGGDPSEEAAERSGDSTAPLPEAELSEERRESLGELQTKIGIRFNSISYLEQALKHRSYIVKHASDRAESNERMEFLGDSVLGLLVSEYLYETLPNESEGSLTKIKSLVVSRAVLAQAAEGLELGDFIRLSEEEIGSGGRKRKSILSDSFEALVGAIFLDQGLSVARRFVRSHLLNELSRIIAYEDVMNYKSILQERVQAEFKTQPIYRVRSETGPDHSKTFSVEVLVSGRVCGTGRGGSKKEAEQAAARQAIDVIRRTRLERMESPQEAANELEWLAANYRSEESLSEGKEGTEGSPAPE